MLCGGAANRSTKTATQLPARADSSSGSTEVNARWDVVPQLSSFIDNYSGTIVAISICKTRQRRGDLMNGHTLKVQSSKSREEFRSFKMEEKITSLFEPDTLVSAQYFQNFRRKSCLEPEKRLILAMLEDAITCFQIYLTARTGKGKKLFNEAEEWIMMTDHDWTFSFVNVCETLGFSPEYIRQGLRRWKRKKPANNTRAESWRQKRTID